MSYKISKRTIFWGRYDSNSHHSYVQLTRYNNKMHVYTHVATESTHSNSTAHWIKKAKLKGVIPMHVEQLQLEYVHVHVHVQNISLSLCKIILQTEYTLFLRVCAPPTVYTCVLVVSSTKWFKPLKSEFFVCIMCYYGYYQFSETNTQFMKHLYHLLS